MRSASTTLTHKRSPAFAAPLCVDIPGILRTPRLVLRPLTSADWPQFRRVVESSGQHLAPSKLWRAGEAPRKAFERQLALTEQGARTGRAWRRAGFSLDGRLVGCFNLNDISRGLEFSGELSWWIAAESLGQGFGREGVAASIDHAMGDLPLGLGLHTLRAHIRHDNQRSIRLASALGLVRTSKAVEVPTPDGWERHEVWEISVTLPSPQRALPAALRPAPAARLSVPAASR